MKQKLTNQSLLFKVFILGFSLLLWNCEPEDPFIIKQNQQKDYEIHERSYSELSKKKEFNRTMDRFSLKRSTSMSSIYDFQIDSTSIKEITFGENISYTFNVKRETDSLHFFENLVLTVDSLNNTSAMLLKYYPDNPVQQVEHHATHDFHGQAELTLLDYQEVLSTTSNRTTDLICFMVSTTYCTETGYEDGDGVNYTGTHVAGEFCDEPGFTFTVTNQVCFSVGSPVPELINISDDGGNGPTYTTGGGQLPNNYNGLPFILTSPSYDYGVQNLISILGLNNIFQYESELIEYLQNNLDIATQIHIYLGQNPTSDDVASATDVIRVLTGVSPPSILDAYEEHRLHASIIGSELNNRGRLFNGMNISFGEIDVDNVLSLSDWQLITPKLQEIYSILPDYDGLVLDDYFQLTDEHQRLVLENALFSYFLPNVKSIVGDYWPETAEEWAAIGTILGEFLLELGLAVIPGSGIADAVSALQNNEYIAASIALATVVVDFFGGTILKFLGKMGKIIYKTFKIFRIIRKHLKPFVNAINAGLKFVLDNQVVRIVDNFGNEIARIVDNILTFRYLGFGGDIVTTSGKTTTIIGKYDVNGVGTRNLIESGLTKQGENLGGLNVLQESIDGLTDEQIWLQINKPWIDEAIARGDVIRVISDPNLQSNLFNNGIPSFFKREIDYLTDPNGYNLTFNPFNNTFE